MSIRAEVKGGFLASHIMSQTTVAPKVTLEIYPAMPYT